MAAYVRRVGKGRLAAAAQAFGVTRPPVAGLRILHEEAQGATSAAPLAAQLATSPAEGEREGQA